MSRMKTKGNYQMIKYMDKNAKNKQISLWQQKFPKEVIGDSFPVFLKGIHIMRLNDTPLPSMGTVVFFAIKNLILTDVTMFGFDKSRMESEAKALLKFSLDLKTKLKLDTKQIYLRHEIGKNSAELGCMCYVVDSDELDGKPCHLCKPLTLYGVDKRGKKSNISFLVYPGHGGVFRKEKGKKPQPIIMTHATGTVNS